MVSLECSEDIRLSFISKDLDGVNYDRVDTPQVFIEPFDWDDVDDLQ